ncbi:MAG: peptidase S8, partial [Planctomycetota bacterium]
MAEHIFLPDDFRDVQGYKPPRRIVEWSPPERDRLEHGNRLQQRLQNAWAAIDQQKSQRSAFGIPHPESARITFRLRKESAHKLKGLEALHGGQHLEKVRLRHVFTDVVDGEEFIVAMVWVPKRKRRIYAQKLQEYLSQETKGGKPKNNDLIACIEDIRIALLEDYWPKHEQTHLPGDEADWIEVWLAAEWTDEKNEATEERFKSICETLSIDVADRRLLFPERRVLLIQANKTQLQTLIEYSDDIAEFRMARECTGFFMHEPEIHTWIDDLQERVIGPRDDSPAICVLDTGVNRGHRLLEPVCQASDCLTVMESWGVNDHHPRGHGTGMCGLTAYGPLELPLASSEPVTLTHWVESVKLLGPEGHVDTLPKDLWGQFTQRAAYEIEIIQPERSRSFCMAITSIEDRDRGMPSSWSGAVDQLTSGYMDDNRRLMMISAGNVDGDDEWLAYPDSNVTNGIHDPAQAWNALTVGAYTDKVTFRDEDGSRDGFVPLAAKGDLSPYSTTTLSDWDKAWPIKPEIVCEGGNLLRTPDGHIAGHDDLECLTTSRNDSIQPLATMCMTSGATALASWMAGQIQAAYPNAWPETIRALMVHSAR